MGFGIRDCKLKTANCKLKNGSPQFSIVSCSRLLFVRLAHHRVVRSAELLRRVDVPCGWARGGRAGGGYILEIVLVRWRGTLAERCGRPGRPPRQIILMRSRRHGRGLLFLLGFFGGLLLRSRRVCDALLPPLPLTLSPGPVSPGPCVATKMMMMPPRPRRQKRRSRFPCCGPGSFSS